MTASFADQDIWHVLVASDDMKRMNVEQLDDAFRLSLVDASTLVWKTGMKTWERLGLVAGLEDEDEEEEAPAALAHDETITKQMSSDTLAQLVRLPPPPPKPAPLRGRTLTPAPSRPAPPRTAPPPYVAAPPPPRTAPPPPRTAPAPLRTAPPPYVAAPSPSPQPPAPRANASSYAPQLVAPDPYTLPKRRVAVPSEVDFRRAPGGRRAGRWLLGLLVITAGVLVCYRQNLLLEGARKLGLEQKYLFGEQRVTGYVSARAPQPVQDVLKRLALLPGPNAAPLAAAALEPSPAAAPAPLAAAAEATAAAPEAAPAAAAAPNASARPSQGESAVETVALDSLPVLSARGESEDEATARAAAPSSAAPSGATRSAVKASVAPAARKTKATTPKAEKVTQQAKAEKVAKQAKAKEPKSSLPPPSPNEGFLKSAIRSAIAADAAK